MIKKLGILATAASVFCLSYWSELNTKEKSYVLLAAKSLKTNSEPKIDIHLNEDHAVVITWSDLDIVTDVAGQKPEGLCFDFNSRTIVKMLPLVKDGTATANLPDGQYTLMIHTCRTITLSVPFLTLLSPPQIAVEFTVKLPPKYLDI
jgi:hypothetical protein